MIDEVAEKIARTELLIRASMDFEICGESAIREFYGDEIADQVIREKNAPSDNTTICPHCGKEI